LPQEHGDQFFEELLGGNEESEDQVKTLRKVFMDNAETSISDCKAD
jgi:hypothetical protein